MFGRTVTDPHWRKTESSWDANLQVAWHGTPRRSRTRSRCGGEPQMLRAYNWVCLDNRAAQKLLNHHFPYKWPYWGMYPIFRHTLVNMIAWVITCTLTFTTSTVKLPGWGLMWVGAAQVLPQALSMKIFGLVSCKHADLQAGVSGNGVYHQKASIIGQWWFTNGIGIALFSGKHKVSSLGQIKLDSASQLRVVPLIG